MIEVNNKTRSKINSKEIVAITEKFLKYYKKDGKEVSIAFVGDTIIRNLNKKYREIDRITDILSFSGEEKYLGEIVIDYTQVKRQAKKYCKSAKEELRFILVHGLLHLLGYYDKTDKEREEMIKLGEKFLKTI